MLKNRFLAILGVIVLLGVFAWVNAMNLKATPKGDDDDDDNSTPPAKTSTSAPATPPSPPGKPGAGDNGTMVSEETDGNPATAKTKVTIGFYADPTTESSPSTQSQSVAAARQWVAAHPGSSLQVVCLDIPPQMRQDPSTASVPQGLAINGKPLSPNDDFKQGLSVPAITGMLQSVGRPGPGNPGAPPVPPTPPAAPAAPPAPATKQ